jgi:hypothetical protein
MCEKSSPAQGRNPSTTLADAQFSHCVKILEAEVKILEPRRIVFLTGLNWVQPFLKELNFVSDSNAKYPLEASGHIFNGSNVVVVPHPERKPEEPIVSAVVNYFQSNLKTKP